MSANDLHRRREMLLSELRDAQGERTQVTDALARGVLDPDEAGFELHYLNTKCDQIATELATLRAIIAKAEERQRR
jgi:hypothetical protein